MLDILCILGEGRSSREGLRPGLPSPAAVDGGSVCVRACCDDTGRFLPCYFWRPKMENCSTPGEYSGALLMVNQDVNAGKDCYPAGDTAGVIRDRRRAQPVSDAGSQFKSLKISPVSPRSLCSRKRVYTLWCRPFSLPVC